jgi:hypothetical protein
VTRAWHRDLCQAFWGEYQIPPNKDVWAETPTSISPFGLDWNAQAENGDLLFLSAICESYLPKMCCHVVLQACHFCYFLYGPPTPSLSQSVIANLTVCPIARGVNADELFQYSSGRWLINEKSQLAQRYVKFDVDQLCKRVSFLFGETPVLRIDKMEGNFNKALLLTMRGGREVIAKIPCPNAGPPHYTTASEVATLEFGM